MTAVPLDPAVAAPRPSRFKRIVKSAPMRIVIGAVLLLLTAALSFGLIKAAVPAAAARFVWPYLLITVLLGMMYWLYVRLMEGRRSLPEFALPGAPAEFGVGLLLGAGAVALAMGLLAASGNYQVTGMNPWSAKIAGPLAEMLFVGVFEELLFRAVLFRITERALGSWPALVISSILFALAHLGESISFLGLANTAVAGLALSAAWMATRRLWLCVAIHAAWNYTLGSIFSIAVSGHPAKGLVIGAMSGPDWVTGGVYGLEGSVTTLLVMGLLAVILLLRARVKGSVLPSRWSAAGQGAARSAII
ncbi:MAG: CPBP family intramembrane glutamic endopeptidase [Massilia sp.]